MSNMSPFDCSLLGILSSKMIIQFSHVPSSLILGLCFVLTLMSGTVSLSLVSNGVASVKSIKSISQLNKLMAKTALVKADSFSSEMERNYTVFKDGYKKGGLTRQGCGTLYKSSPTLMFLCLYASPSGNWVPDVYEEGEGETVSRRKGPPTSKHDNKTEPSFDADVCCVKKKIEPEDEHVHQPIRTISCCQSSNQTCTYDQSESPKSKYIARCHTKTKEFTEYVTQCCEKYGEAEVEPPNYSHLAEDYKCY